MRNKKPRDTLEQIVEEAKERERLINEQHPERHGYGMIQGEADDLIERIEKLERSLIRAQRVKITRRAQKIRLTGNDKIFHISPEDMVLHKMDKKKINNAEAKVLREATPRSRDIYYMREDGFKLKDISEKCQIHWSNVSRDFGKTRNKLKEEFMKIMENDKENVYLRGFNCK